MTHPSRRHRAVLLAPALLLGATLAGCGGDGAGEAGAEGGLDGASSSVPGQAITKDDFVEQANQICLDGNQELASRTAALDPTDRAAIRAFVTDVYAPSIRQQIEDIRALGYPEGDQDTLDGLLTDAEAVVAEVQADPAGAFLGGSDPFAEVTTGLDDYGLTECGSV